MAVFSTLVVNDHHLILVADPGTEGFMARDEAFSRADEDVVAGNGHQLWIYAWTEIGDVRVTVRVHGAAPRGMAGGEAAAGEPDAGEPDDGWDGVATLEQRFPTGRLQVATLTGGPDAEWPLPQPGAYGVRAQWRRRELFQEEVLALLVGFSTPGGGFDHAAFAAAEQALTDREEYLLDLWPLPG